jgi:hypothetical protein
VTPTLARKRNQHLEDDLQAALVQHIELRKVPGLVWWHTMNSSKLGGARTRSGVPLAAIRAKRLGLRAGVSDLVFLHEGIFYALELKSKGQKPSSEQFAFLDAVRMAGGVDFWTDNLDKALRWLEQFKLIR